MSLTAHPVGAAERRSALRASLAPDARLRLAPGVRTRFDASGRVLVQSPDGTFIDAGPRGFDILSLFSEPLALGAALERLEADGPDSTEFLPALSVINALLEEGALVEPEGDWALRTGWA